MQPLLSLCMIVKNEERVLDRCLNSVKNLVDEIIIVDTGSTDQTKEIAARHGASIYDFVWTNSFADARNESIKYATGRWILFLDADEYVQSEHHDNFRQVLASLERDHPTAILLTIVNFNGASLKNITGTVQFSTTRVFNNSQGFYFMNPIHEQLVSRKGEEEYLQDSFKIYHTGYIEETKKEKNKSERNLQLHNQLKQQSGFGAFYSFTLGNEYSSINDNEKALYYYKKADKKSSEGKLWFPLLLERLTVTSFQLKRYTDTLKYCRRGLGIFPQRVDFYYLKAAVFYEFGLYDEAKQLAEHALTIAESKKLKNEQYWVTSTDYGGTFCYVLLSNIYSHYFNYQQQVHYLSRALNETPSNLQYLTLLLQRFKWHESEENIDSFIRKHYPLVQTHDMFLVYVAAMKVGYAPLAESYYKALRSAGYVFSPADQLQHELLLNNTAALEKLLGEHSIDLTTEDERLSAFAASYVVYDGPTFTKLADTNEHWKIAVDEIRRHLADPEYIIPIRSRHISLLLSKLMIYGYFEQYDQLIQRCSDPYYIDHMGDEFMEVGQIDMALTYYKSLLPEQSLGATGYYHLGRLYVLQDDRDTQLEGLSYLEQAIRLNPDLRQAYIFYCKYETDSEKKQQMKLALINQFPWLNEIQEIRDL